MSTETHIDRARDRVRAEQDAVDAKLIAFKTFSNRVANLPTETSPPPSPGVMATAGTQPRVNTSPTADSRCRAVRTAFAETVQPHSIDDVDEPEPLLATIETEFTESIATALAPTTNRSFTADLKQAVIAEASARRIETAVMRRALDREDTALETAAVTVDEITAWIEAANETPLTDFGFEELQRRHQALAAHRDRCEDLTIERQGFLRETTSRNVEAGVRHRNLVHYLYEGLSIDHPVLASSAHLDATCATCQRVIRRHLVQRV